MAMKVLCKEAHVAHIIIGGHYAEIDRMYVEAPYIEMAHKEGAISVFNVATSKRESVHCICCLPLIEGQQYIAL